MTATISKLPLIRLAERHINLGNPRGAIEPLRRVLADNPDHALAHAYLGMRLQKIGQPAAALASIQTALALAPEYGFVSYTAGFAPGIMLFVAHRDLLAWTAIAGFALCIGGLWVAKKLFARAIRKSLHEFRLRQSF
jgi:tetratricopeptide (TPR) repeat protein